MKSPERAPNQRASRRAIDVHERRRTMTTSRRRGPDRMPPGDPFHLEYSYARVAIVDAVETIDEPKEELSSRREQTLRYRVSRDR